MLQAKERDKLLTKTLVEMEAELRKARITQTVAAGTNVEESLIDERLHTLPSEGGGGGGGGPPRPPNMGGAPNPGDDDPDYEGYLRAPNRRSDDPRRPAPNPVPPINPLETERISEILARTMARGSRRAAQPLFRFESKPNVLYLVMGHPLVMGQFWLACKNIKNSHH